MSTLAHKVRQEVRELIPVTLFFFVAFQLLALPQALILHEYGIAVSTFLAATLMAMIVAKVVVFTDRFRFVNRCPEKPLIYGVVWKTAIYFIVSLVVRYAEHLIHAWRKSSSLSEAKPPAARGDDVATFLGRAALVPSTPLRYYSLRELIPALGRDRGIGMFYADPVGTASKE